MTNYTIDFNDREINYLLSCINNDIKTNGLNVAENGVYMASKLKAAITPPEQEAVVPTEQPTEEVNSE